MRQLDGGRLHQQAGGHGLQRPLLIDRATSPMDGDQGHPAGSEVPPRPSQCPSEPAQPLQPSPGCRMVTPSSGGERSTAQVGFPHPGPVCNTPQCQAAAVLLPDSGPSGSPRGCLPPPLEQPRRVCIPPLPPGREGSGAGQRDPKSLDDPRRTPLAREGMVCGPTPSPNPTSTSTAAVGLTAKSTPLPQVPRRCPCSEPSRVASLQRLLRKSGFSRDGAREVSDCVRESTAGLYQSQWLSFCNWCRRRGKALIDATVPLIVDFLVHLRRDKCFSLLALKGYCAAINSVLALKGTDLSDSRELAMLFRGFAKSCPTTYVRPPGLGCGTGPQQPHSSPLRADQGSGGAAPSPENALPVGPHLCQERG